MIETILAAPDGFPAHLHRHILQLYAVRHRRPPVSPREQRRAVYEYLTRTRGDREGVIHIHLSPELTAWLNGEDEQVRGCGPISRLAGIVHQFSPDMRKRFDLDATRDYQEYACTLALTAQRVFRWPEVLIGDAIRSVLWEPAPGVPCASRVGMTRALQYLRRRAVQIRRLDPAKIAEFSQLLMLVLSQMDEGQLPEYALSPAQWDYLSSPVRLKSGAARLTGLMHHLVVERGTLAERDLANPAVIDNVKRETPAVLSRLRLPRRLRDAHGLRTAPVTPIAAAAPARTEEPVVTLVGPLSHGSGLGAAARACGEALKAAGVRAEVLNHVAGWGRTDEDTGHASVATARGDINIIHFNPDVLIENLSRSGLGPFSGRYNIGFGFWESSRACFAHRLGLDLLDELWVSSEYCREVFQQATDRPVLVMRTPIPRIDDVTWASRSYFGVPEDTFNFVFTFDGASRLTRKNPVATVAAFLRAFPDDHGERLVIKTQNTERLFPADARLYSEIRQLARRDRRIQIIDESFSSNEVHGLISVSDCYVSLHRSEGFGFGMAEAMKLRVPVIATNYSGNIDFTTRETAATVDYREIPIPEDDFVYADAGQMWAEPDLEHAVARMREVRAGAGIAAQVERAFERVRELYDERTIGEAYRARLEEIRAGLTRGGEARAAGQRLAALG